VIDSPAAVEAQFPDAQPLASNVRTQMETAFGQSLTEVRVHPDGLARIGETSASAVAVGQTIVFDGGAYAPSTLYGQALLAHELAHTLQQERGNTRTSSPAADEQHADQLAASAIARSRGASVSIPSVGARSGLSLRRCNNFDPDKAKEQAKAAERNVPATPPASPKQAPKADPAVTLDSGAVRKPKDDDMFVVAYGSQMIALPAKNLVYDIVVKPTEIQSQVMFGVPTVGKEGLRLLNIGGREAVMIDSGGKPKALMPAALRTIKSALGVKDIIGINTLHIHDDHIRNFEKFIIDNKIEAQHLRFPKAFEDAGKKFTQILDRLRTTDDPRLIKLGYGRGAATPFTMWDVPDTGVFDSYQLGDKHIEEYGLPEAFDKLARKKATTSNDVDRASVILKATDDETGKGVVVIGDPRGATLKELRDVLGEVVFGQIFENVEVLNGIQHHTGALTSNRDREGLEILLVEILTRNPRLTIVEQSSIQPYPGKGTPKPFMNASLIEALRQFGIGHRAGLDPEPKDPKSIGTITIDNDAKVRSAGKNIAATVGDPVLAERLERFHALDQAIKALTENERILSKPGGGPIKDQIATRTTRP
jgi:hypothetical protein